MNCTIFLTWNCIFFPANEEATLITKQPIRFQGLFKVTNQIAGKWKTKSIIWQILQLLFLKLIFPLKNWMNLISNRLSTASTKYLNWPSPVFGRFQNGCNKMVIEPRVVQFCSEIILVISNRTRAAHLSDFEITRMISAQIALHSVQLPLLSAKVLHLLDKDIEEGVHTLEKTIMWEVLFTLFTWSDQKWDSPDVIDKIASKEVGRRQKYQLEYYIWLNTTFSELKLLETYRWLCREFIIRFSGWRGRSKIAESSHSTAIK